MTYQAKGDDVTKSELNAICQKTYEYKTKNGSYPAYTTFNNIQIMKEELYDALVRCGNYDSTHTTPASMVRVGDAVITPTPTPTPVTDPDEGLKKFCPTEVLEKGSHDYCVGFLEKKLKEYGFYDGIIDNDFGPVLKQAVIDFQTATGHTADGVVGPKTWPDVLNYTPTTTPVTGEFSEYLQATNNCQVNDPTIQSIAKQIANAQGVFDFVLGLNYDYYYNTKRGALKTIQDGIGNCSDLSHALVALARAKGIPARYVHSTVVNFTTISCGHVWVELYVNGSWVRADASNNSNTFGNNPKDTMIPSTAKVTRYKELPF